MRPAGGEPAKILVRSSPMRRIGSRNSLSFNIPPLNAGCNIQRTPLVCVRGLEIGASMRLVTFKNGSQAPAIGVIVENQVFTVGNSSFPDMTSFLLEGNSALAEAEALNRGAVRPKAKYP